MKKILFALLFFLCVSAHAQTYFSVGAGLMNYNGDLQQSGLTFSQGRPAFTLGSNIYLRDHFSLNASLTVGGIGADDAKGKWPRRNLNFKSNIFDVSFSAEGDLYELRDYQNDGNDLIKSNAKNFTPYAFAGIGFFNFNPYTYDKTGAKVFLQPLGTEGQGLPEYPDRQLYSIWQLNIPFGVGLKYALNQKLLISGELSFRTTFTDYLDDVSSHTYADTTLLKNARGPKAAELSVRAYELKGSDYVMEREYRGNPDKNDNFYTFLFKVSYSFGSGSLFNR